MGNSNNVLILSCGTRNKIVQYFKKNLEGIGKVVATDCSKLAPALNEADVQYIVPIISDINYIDTILEICQKENINGVLSLIDPELSLLAKYKEKFEEIDVKVIGSSYDLCELSLDKWRMYNWLIEHGYKCAKSYICIEKFYEDLRAGKINFPVFVKPYKGSASMKISKVYDEKTLNLLLEQNNDLMIQEFLNGKEIGADCYVDMISDEVVSIFTKYKLAMRAGETDKSVSFKNQTLFNFIQKFVEEIGFKGQIDIDIFEIDGEYFISEVNPRFGGGYPHAYECGVNNVKCIINNLKGEKNVSNIGNYSEHMIMMKFNEIKLICDETIISKF